MVVPLNVASAYWKNQIFQHGSSVLSLLFSSTACIRRHTVWVKDAYICVYMAKNNDDVTASRSISTLSYWTLGLPIYLTGTSL